MNTDSPLKADAPLAQKIAAIVPAFNEEATIGKVVGALVASGLFGEVMVVSDGSNDKTAERAKAAGARVYELSRNRGKGQAMQYGVSQTDAQILFFSDADLYGFEKKNMEALLAPVLAGECAMSVGLRDRGPFWTRVSGFLPLIGGERVLRCEVFEHLPAQYLRGFMAEIIMNEYCARHNLKICKVVMPGVTIRRKMQKVGFWSGLYGYIKMFWQIGQAVILVRMGYLGKRF